MKALIYCRVSSKGQTGLGSQEHRCREYAKERGYDVEAVFPDDVTGGGDFMKRPGMVALLAYLDAKSEENYVVIFDDLKRYARDTEFHLKLRRIMGMRGAIRECLNFNFEDSPEGKFLETIVAAQGELEREQNGRQVAQKMKARMEQGFWVHKAPVGFKYERSKQGGKILTRDEPLASIVQEAMEGFASGRFQTQGEVKNFLEAQPEFPKDLPNGGVRFWKVRRLLSRLVYAGYLDSAFWGISYRKAQHKGLVSLQTFQKIQERLQDKAMAPARRDIDLDFILRGSVVCADCGTALTSCWSKGKYQSYPYYLCRKKGCDSYGKSIRRDKLEGDFETLLGAMQPSAKLARFVEVMFKDAWSQTAAQFEHVKQALQRDIAKLDKQIEVLVDRIVETENQTVASAMEKKITKLEREKLVASEKLQNGVVPKPDFEELLELSTKFLTNPYKLWCSGDAALRKLVLRLSFSERLEYCRNEGYRTPVFSLPFKALGGVLGSEMGNGGR